MKTKNWLHPGALKFWVCIILFFSITTSYAQVAVTATAGTVGPTTYTTLKGAIDAVNAGTHQGSVTIDLSANTTETATSVLNSSGAGAAVYTALLIRPVADGIVVSGPSLTGRGLIELNGADNVTIDGDNPNTTGINRNLTITNTAATSVTFTAVIRLATSTLVLSADNVTIKNCILNGSGNSFNSSSNTSFTTTQGGTSGIFVGAGASTATVTTVPTALAANVNNSASGQTFANLTINNNQIMACGKAIAVCGAATSNCPVLTIKDNTIGNAVEGATNQVYWRGILAQGYGSSISSISVISGNTIYVESYCGNTSAPYGPVGIDLGGATSNTVASAGGSVRIEKNKILRVKQNNTSGYPAEGINLQVGNGVEVQNNFIAGVINYGSGSFSTTYGAQGIRVATGNNHLIQHNTVALAGADAGSSNMIACLSFVGVATTGCVVNNNIFSNTCTTTSTSSSFTSIFFTTTPTAGMALIINNNAYYTGTNSVVHGIGQVTVTKSAANLYSVANFNNAATSPATNWRSITNVSTAGNDNASFGSTVAAPFVSATDLHINPGNVNAAALDATGTAGTEVYDDIDNESRSVLTPTDIGADAFTISVCVVPVSQPTGLNLTSVTASSLSGSFTASVPSVDNYLVVRSTSSTLSANPVNGTTYVVGNSIGGGTVVRAGSSTTFNETGLSAATTYYYFIFSYNSLCTGGPTYNVTTPLTNNASTCLAAPVSTSAVPITVSGFTANWTAVAGATGYLLDVSTSNTFASFVAGYNGVATGNVISYPVTGLSGNTNYYYRIRATGTFCTSTNSATQTAYTGYCSSTSTGTTYYMNSFSTTGGITNISNSTPGAISAGGYGDFTAQSASQIPGAAVSFAATFSSSTYGFAIFIDWNNDMDFLDAGEMLYNSAGYVSPASGSFTVPVSQAVGSYRMRVVANYNSTTPVSCNTMTNGETEDYTFNVIATPNCSGTPTVGNTLASNSSLCLSGSANLSLAGVSSGVSGITYQWQSSPDGGSYSNIASANSATYATGSISMTTYYQSIVTCTFSGVSAISTPVTITVNNPSVSSTTPAARCGTGTVTLQATGTSTLKWYAAASGGVALGTGTSFVTPVISATTNYFVESAAAGAPVAVGLVSPSAGGTPTTQTTGWDINFTVLSATTLQSIDIYPLASGQTGSFTVRNGTGLTGTILATINYTTNVSGGTVPQTITFNTALTPGNYSVVQETLPTSGVRRNNSGAVYPYTSAVANITGSGFGAGYFQGAYNWIFGSQCASARTSVTATVNAAPTIVSSGGQVLCGGSPSTPVSITTGASDYDVYTWTPSINVTGNLASGWIFTPSATTTYTLAASQSGGSLCANSTTAVMTVKATPAANAGSNTGVCPGSSTTLNGSGTVAPVNVYSNDLSSLAGWTTNDSDIWGSFNESYAGGAAPELAMENIYYTGTMNLWVRSPLIDLTSYTQFSSMTLSFKHYIEWAAGNFNVYLETSPDGTTWTQRWTQNITSNVAATTVNVNMDALIGQSFYVRFRFNGNIARIYYWAIDDISINATPTMTYAWTPTTGLSNPNIQNPVATPSTATTYTLVTNYGGCPSAPSTVSVAINTATPANIATATSTTLATGDFLWNGYGGTDWTTPSNWYVYNGSAFVQSTAVPANTTRVFILPNTTTNACISGSNNTTVTAGGDANNVFIGTGATMLINAGQVLNVNGNWTNNGTFTPNITGVVNMTGGNAQTIGGTSATHSFTNLTINKSGNAVNLSKPVSVTANLVMTAGNIITTATNLLTVGTSPASPATLAWTGGTVIGPLKRFISGTASATLASGIFPVGNATYNRYARVNFTSNPGAGGFITAEYKNGACPVGYSGLPATINGLMITNYENEGYWEITPTGVDLNTTPYDLTLRGNNLSSVTALSQLRIIKSSNHTAWNDNPAGDGNHLAASGTISDFTIGASAMVGFSWFNVGADNANPLPVTLINFSAFCDNGVTLKWSTASEANSEKFIVEKSRDLNNWSYVNELPAAGNSNYKLDYTSLDADNTAGISYYRLVQVDNDGIKKVFGPISVSCSDLENSMIVFPNPAKGVFTVEITSQENLGNAVIQVMDLSGKTVSVRELNLHEGKNQVLFDEANLQNGTYIVKLASEKEFKSVKLVINQ